MNSECVQFGSDHGFRGESRLHRSLLGERRGGRQHLINIQESNDIVYAVITKPTEDGFYYVFDYVTLRFADNGLPYDPTAAAVPDTTLSAEERVVSGLGFSW